MRLSIIRRLCSKPSARSRTSRRATPTTPRPRPTRSSPSPIFSSRKKTSRSPRPESSPTSWSTKSIPGNRRTSPNLRRPTSLPPPKFSSRSLRRPQPQPFRLTDLSPRPRTSSSRFTSPLRPTTLTLFSLKFTNPASTTMPDSLQLSQFLQVLKKAHGMFKESTRSLSSRANWN